MDGTSPRGQGAEEATANNDGTPTSSSGGTMLRDPWASLDESQEEDATTISSTTTTTTTTTTNNNTNTNTNNTNNTTPSTPTNTSAHKFQPGDHVIRWEMLPIAWPIQIHGIVLSVSDMAVVLVDFGLAAAPDGVGEAMDPVVTADTDANASTDASTNASTNTNTPPARPTAHKIIASFQNMHPKAAAKKKKNRLNVVVLEDPTEWTKWKKVNYDGGGLFGFGSGNGGDGKKEGEGDEAAKLDENGGGTKQKWWKKLSKSSTGSFETENDEGDGAATIVTATATATATAPQKPRDATDTGGLGSGKWWKRTSSPSSSTAAADTAKEAVESNVTTTSTSTSTWWTKMTTTNTTGGTQDTADTSNGSFLPSRNGAPDPGEEPPPSTPKEAEPETTTTKTNGGQDEFKEDPSDEETETPTDPATNQSSFSYSNRAMNPAMATLMQGQKNKEEAETLSFNKKGFFGGAGRSRLFGKKASSDDGTVATEDETKDTSASSTKKSAANKKKLNLPKADPPKLVLARTRWLLYHGESLLPPYHVFHSNSECIAVFCKTGYWSNLQADVFLHSTAIGNAKTMGAATLGVAASVPLLAPVIAGLGIGMVAAPWLILHSSKQHADGLTQTMTDQFWAQAEPEVFVECIEHWSKLEDYYKQQQQQQQQQQQKEQQQKERPTKPTDKPKEEASNGRDRAGENDQTATAAAPKDNSPKVVSL